jgi:hypothetical protein
MVNTYRSALQVVDTTTLLGHILWLLQYLDRKHTQANIQKRWYHATNYRVAFETSAVSQWRRKRVSIYVC